MHDSTMGENKASNRAKQSKRAVSLLMEEFFSFKRRYRHGKFANDTICATSDAPRCRLTARIDIPKGKPPLETRFEHELIRIGVQSVFH